MFRTIMAGAIALAAVTAAGTAGAQATYPEKSVRFLVPFAAGSATDTLARVLGQHMSQTLGQSIVVENIPGANGSIAASQVARAAPDGYTVLMATNTTHAANQNMMKTMSYDPVKDFAPVTKLGDIPLAFIANPSVPANTVQELVAHAKANPGQLSFGSGSSSSRIAAEMVRSMTGIEMLHVPYKSNPQAIQDLLGGQISLVFADLATTLPHVRAGKAKGLAVSGARRAALAPELPTMAEAGVPGYELTAWFAAFVPAGTPKPVIEKLHAAFTAAIKDKDSAARLNNAGIEPTTSTPEELAALVQSETKKWADIVQAAGIQKE
ncbi:tripartite tricarboxylate transporter substrate binding protein [Azospirillum sp. SYSU D00513]|uniref:Bug family tripartite tricarboxylate transporter substrate binding protein n=1 Tax=Azospirillum sp. SYSU D00513 TaxID=2812561 RepID=UPI001A95926F|nr:tripartite tricarboxylate transporter substrate binding protein [Azospirillum sp. SYSU D00513]